MIFLNHKIELVKDYITTAVLLYCDRLKDTQPELADMLDVGAMSKSEFADEMIMELIRYAYDLKSEKSSIRSHLKRENILSDSNKEAYGRALKYAQDYRDKEADLRTAQTDTMPDDIVEALRGSSMDNIEDKLSGHKINAMQFFELTQLWNIRILKSMVEHRLEDSKKVSNAAFMDLYGEYEKFIEKTFLKENPTDEELVFNTIAYWVLEWKFPLTTFYDIAVLDEERHLGEISAEQVCLICGDCAIENPFGGVRTHSRFVKQRGNFVRRTMYNVENYPDEADYDSFTITQYLIIGAYIMENYYMDSGEAFKDWFANETDIADWAEFLREYNLLSMYEKKQWNNKRIRKVRELIKLMTIKY